MSEIVGHIQKVERLQNAVKQMDDVMEKICGLFGRSGGGELGDAAYALLEIAMDGTAASVGVAPEVMRWFAQENEFGAKRLGASVNGEKVVVDSIEAFLGSEKKNPDPEEHCPCDELKGEVARLREENFLLKEEIRDAEALLKGARRCAYNEATYHAVKEVAEATHRGTFEGLIEKIRECRNKALGE